MGLIYDGVFFGLGVVVMVLFVLICLSYFFVFCLESLWWVVRVWVMFFSRV